MIVEILLLTPLLLSIVAYLVDNNLSKWIAISSTIISFALTVYVFLNFNSNQIKPLLEVNKNWLTNPNVNLHLSIDGLSLFMLLLTNFVSLLIVLASFNDKVTNKKSYYSLILLMIFGLNGVFTSSNGFLFYIFWELTLIPIYFIALLWGGSNKIKITFKFFVYTLLGSLFMLVAFIYLYFLNGNLEYNLLKELSIDPKNQLWLFLLIFSAFAIKIPIVPFHSWQANLYKTSPTTGTMLLSGVMLKMGFFGILKWLVPFFPVATKLFTPYIIVFCVVGVLYGALITFSQKNTKKFLAYSSLSHVGLIAAGIFTLNIFGWQGAIIQMLAHAVNVVGLFFSIEVIARRTNTYSINGLGGIRSKAPIFATFFMVIIFASISFPLTNAFIGEYMLLISLVNYNTYLGIAAGITVVLGAAYMLKLYKKIMLGEVTKSTENFKPLHYSEFIVFSLIVIAILGLGIFPQPFIDLVDPFIKETLKLSLR